jgi:hypothetical protein
MRFLAASFGRIGSVDFSRQKKTSPLSPRRVALEVWSAEFLSDFAEEWGWGIED